MQFMVVYPLGGCISNSHRLSNVLGTRIGRCLCRIELKRDSAVIWKSLVFGFGIVELQFRELEFVINNTCGLHDKNGRIKCCHAATVLQVYCQRKKDTSKVA